MNREEIIARTKTPVTIDIIYRGLKNLGVQGDDTIIMHSSMRNLGWICGGAQTVIMGVQKALEPEGTLVMVSHSGDWSDPANWSNPPVPKEWVPIIRENMPAYDKDMTPTRKVGRVAELFRTYPGVIRSDNPMLSFSAWGKHAADITQDCPLAPMLGIESPLGKLYELNVKVLFLGTGYDTCTAFHLAETFLDDMPKIKSGTAMKVNGKRQWVEFEDYDYDSDDFGKMGEAFEAEYKVSKTKIGNAVCRLFSIRDSVDFAKSWLPKNRK